MAQPFGVWLVRNSKESRPLCPRQAVSSSFCGRNEAAEYCIRLPEMDRGFVPEHQLLAQQERDLEREGDRPGARGREGIRVGFARAHDRRVASATKALRHRCDIARSHVTPAA